MAVSLAVMPPSRVAACHGVTMGDCGSCAGCGCPSGMGAIDCASCGGCANGIAGIGDAASDLANELGSQADNSAVVQQWQGLADDTRKQVQSYATTAAPAYNLAATIASGGTPSFLEMTAGVAGAATLIGGPVAGAAIGMAAAGVQLVGSGLESLFGALGLYDRPVAVDCCGWREVGDIPYGPDDPAYLHFDTPSAFYDYTNNRAPNCSDPNNTDRSAKINFLQQALLSIHPDDPAAANASVDTDPFTVFYSHLLVASLNQWANCLTYVDPRDLLVAAAQIWNDTHGDEVQRTYNPHSLNDSWVTNSVVEAVLGNMGGWSQQQVTKNAGHAGQKAAPLRINNGHYIAPPPPALMSEKGFKSLTHIRTTTEQQLAKQMARVKPSALLAAHFAPKPTAHAASAPLSTPAKVAVAGVGVGALALLAAKLGWIRLGFLGL